MGLSLSCTCGARFEVEDSVAGQSVACPECQQAIKVLPVRAARVRTSGYALASMVLALVGMFTVVLSVIAIVVGMAGLVSIARHRERVGGAGYAVFGILTGAIFTAVTLFAISREEIFDGVRATIQPADADFSGPLEVHCPKAGFAITRPSARWGVLRLSADEDRTLVLVNPGTDAYVQVYTQGFAVQSIDQCLDELILLIREPNGVLVARRRMPGKTSGMMERERQRLPPVEGLQVLEGRIDVRQGGVPLSYVVQARRKAEDTRVYFLYCWTQSRRFERVEPELHKAMASFRLLKKE